MTRWAVAPQALIICATLALSVANASAEVITVPFGWVAGQTRVYQVSTRVERVGDLTGGHCTLTARLAVMVQQRDAKSAHMRFLLTALKADDRCETPSMRQNIWAQLAGIPLDMVLQPAAGTVTIPDIERVRESFFAAVGESSQWFGRPVPTALRKDITEQLRKVFVTAEAFAKSTGFVSDLMSAVGGEYDSSAADQIAVSLPNPFGGAPLPATASISTTLATTNRDEFSLTIATRYDSVAYAAALKKMVGAIVAGKPDGAELNSRRQDTIDAGSTMTQRIQRSTGWVVESETKTTTRLNAGTQTDSVKMVFLPNVK